MEASRRANRLGDRKKPVPPAFALVDHAMNELAACGVEAIKLEREATKEILTDACCRAVADAAYRRLYRLSNAKSNQHKMEMGTHKPPR